MRKIIKKTNLVLFCALLASVFAFSSFAATDDMKDPASLYDKNKATPAEQCDSDFDLLVAKSSTGITQFKCLRKGTSDYESFLSGGRLATMADICPLRTPEGGGLELCGKGCFVDMETGTKCAGSATGTYGVSTGEQETTVKVPELKVAECLKVGSSIKKDGECNGTIMPCPEDPLGYRCVPTSQLEKIDWTKLGHVIKPYETKIEIPCSTKIAGRECPVANNPAGYIARLYQFGLMIVGLAALGAIIYGAALYTLSAGNVVAKSDAKDRILQAIFGLLLLLGAYLILYTINPKLVTLINPAAEPINLDTLLPSEIYVPPETGANNTPSESSGVGGIEGCAIASSGGVFSGFIQAEINGEEIYSSGAGGGCAQCMEGNDLENGKCYCKTDLTRRFNGMCCKSTQAIYKGECAYCSNFLYFTENDISALSDNEISNINTSCGTDFCKTGVMFYGKCRTCDRTLKDEIAQSVLSAAKKSEIYKKCGF